MHFAQTKQDSMKIITRVKKKAQYLIVWLAVLENGKQNYDCNLPKETNRKMKQAFVSVYIKTEVLNPITLYRARRQC